jgi:hypothetical protein
MFASDLSFSKAVMAGRAPRPDRRPQERVYRVETDRPAPRRAAPGGR